MSKTTHEIVAAATVEARRFLAGVKSRKMRTDGGRIVDTTEIAAALVKRAELEHAVLPGKRPAFIFCADCKAAVKVMRAGRLPTRCKRHARRVHDKKQKRKYLADPTHKARQREHERRAKAKMKRGPRTGPREQKREHDRHVRRRSDPAYKDRRREQQRARRARKKAA